MCKDYPSCDIAFNVVMPLSRAPTRGRYSRIEGVTGMEHHRRREVELRRRCDAMSVQPLWWRRVGLAFVRGVGEDVVVPVEQVKAALWGWSSRDRRGVRRSSSLEVEDEAAEPAGRRDG